MLTHPTLNRLVTLGLTGMAKAFDEQQRQPDITALAFEERFALLVDREATERENKRRVDRATSEPADHRPDRCRQELDCLCARPQGLP